MKKPELTRRQLIVGLGASTALERSIQAQTPSQKIFQYTFNQGTHGWIPGLCDYALEATRLGFTAEVRQLPPNFQSKLRAYYLQSDNTPDDLFMFLKKELTILDGIEPDTTYSVSIHVGFLSNAPSGGAGIGGAPGTNVVLKAGVSLLEPVAILDTVQSYVGLNLDKGSQFESGRDIQVMSNIENGQPPQEDPPYVYLERLHHFPALVRTDHRGALWITVGTESGFEGRTGIYYYEIIVTLRPL